MVVSLLKLILTKKTLVFLELSMKYLDIPNNQLKKTLIRLEFKSDNIIKSKAIKSIINKILPNY